MPWAPGARMRSINTKRRAWAAPFTRQLWIGPCPVGEVQDAPHPIPSAARAPPKAAPARPACPLQQRAASALSPLLPLPFLFFHIHHRAGNGRGRVGGAGGRRAGFLVSVFCSAWLCIVDGCNQSVSSPLPLSSFFLLPLIPSPLSLSLIVTM